MKENAFTMTEEELNYVIRFVENDRDEKRRKLEDAQKQFDYVDSLFKRLMDSRQIIKEEQAEESNERR